MKEECLEWVATSLRDWAVLHQNALISLDSFDRTTFLDLLEFYFLYFL